MTVISKVRYNYKGEWDSTLTYAVDDLVTYKNRSYRAKIVTTAGNTPQDYPLQWELMVSAFDYMGDWSNAVAYKVGDTVTVDSSPTTGASSPRTLNSSYPLERAIATYICVSANTNQHPYNNTTYWALMARGAIKNYKSFAWPAGRGIVPSTGVYDSAAGAGWAPTTARPGDSVQDGGLGYAYCSSLMHPGIITRSGGVMTWGTSFNGRNGNGTDNGVWVLQDVTFPFNEWYEGGLPTPDGKAPRCIQLFTSYGRCLALFNNGEVYSWGYGGHGQNGGGNSNTIYHPVRVGNTLSTTVLRNKKAIRIATSHMGGSGGYTAAACYALMSDNTLWSWGYNGYGQLGHGDTTNRGTPTQINTAGLNGTVVDVWASGSDYGQLYVLTSTGYMYACGYNGYGELGVGDSSQRNSLTLVKAWGTTTTKVKKFVVGESYSAGFCAVLDASNQLWTWGYNGYGQLGHDDTTNRTSPTAVSYNGTDVRNVWIAGGGSYGSMYVTRTANLVPYSCGYNGYYNLGRPYSDSNRTHSNGGNSTTSWDSYRLQPMYFETSTTAPYYGTLTNVHEIQLWKEASSYTGVGVEQIDGTKWFSSYHAGYGCQSNYSRSTWQTDTYLCAGNTGNYLFKRVQYIASGVTEAELGYFPTCTDSNYFGTVWYDRYGRMYYSGATLSGSIGFGLKAREYTATYSGIHAMSKLPGV